MSEVKVDKDKCIGCGLCVSIAEEVFEMGEDGKAKLVGGYKKNKGNEGKMKEAIDSCPVCAITLSN